MKEGQTKTGNQTLYITLGITTIVLGGLGYWYYRKRNKKDNEVELLAQEVASVAMTSSNTKPRPVTTSTKFRCTSSSYPLEYGTCHKDVKIIQRYLVSIYNADLGRSGSHRDGVDGMFGSKTSRAVKKYLGKVSFSTQDIGGIKTALKSIKR